MPIAALLLFAPSLYGQERMRCFFDDFARQYGQMNVEPSTHGVQPFHTEKSIVLRSTHKVIPVYVHIVYRTDDQNLSDSLLALLFLKANQELAFHRRGHRGIPPIFYPYIETPSIELCPYERQSDGRVALRIRRKKTTIKAIGDVHNGRIFYDSLGGSDAVDPTHYLNIWITEMDDYALGYSSFPDMAGASNDGIILNIDYLRRNGPMTYKARTLIHELGHYLGLCHLAGCRTASCDDDDGIEDTPNSDMHYAWSSCPTAPQISCGSEDMFMNYLSLAPDSCILFFTKGQVERMHRTLTTVRTSLARSHCPTPITSEPPWQDIQLVYNPFQQQLWLQLPHGFDRPITCVVYGTDGRLIARMYLTAQTSLLSVPVALAPGWYVLYFIDEGQTRSKMFFVPPN